MFQRLGVKQKQKTKQKKEGGKGFAKRFQTFQYLHTQPPPKFPELKPAELNFFFFSLSNLVEKRSYPAKTKCAKSQLRRNFWMPEKEDGS